MSSWELISRSFFYLKISVIHSYRVSVSVDYWKCNLWTTLCPSHSMKLYCLYYFEGCPHSHCHGEWWAQRDTGATTRERTRERTREPLRQCYQAAATSGIKTSSKHQEQFFWCSIAHWYSLRLYFSFQHYLDIRTTIHTDINDIRTSIELRPQSDSNRDY